MMKRYNVKESWGIVGEPQESELTQEVLFYFSQLKNRVAYDKTHILMYKTLEFIRSPVFVPSLVSPHTGQRMVKL